MDNGACCQLITKKTGIIWGEHAPVMSKKLFKDLKLVGYLFTDNETERLKEKHYKKSNVVLYRFNIEKMINAGY